MFRWVHPSGGDVDDLLGVVLETARSTPRRPWLMVNMVASLDGATTVKGRSSGLQDDDDLEMFRALRTAADVILVGAGTVRAEDYGPVKLTRERLERRRALGLTDFPRIAVISGRLELDSDSRLFSDPGQRPILLTGPSSDPAKREELSAVAEVVVLEEVHIDAVLASIGGEGVVLCEGGPHLNAQVAAAGRLDEINLTVAPLLTGGTSKRILEGALVDPPSTLKLDRILAGDRSLFLRYRAT